MNIDLTDAKFHDENVAREWFELSRWPNGASCVHCGDSSVFKMEGKAHRPGLFHCRNCRGQFTVRTGHVMESSKVPLTKWALAFHLMTASKKGISAHQLHRTIKVAYNTAWFMEHRIREAMADTNPAPLGGYDKVIEVDETYHGKSEVPHVPSKKRYGRPYTKGGKTGGFDKRQIVALVERGGKARAQHMTHITGKSMKEFLDINADRGSRLHTDESKLYPEVGKEFLTHETVQHRIKEYVRGDVTTNTVEGFFGLFKRGFNGIYQHCGEQHLQRYLDEYTFRYSNRAKLGIEDARRAVIATQGGEGKRLTWRRPD